MTYRQYIRTYVALFFTTLLIISLFSYFGVNACAQIGAVIICIAVLSGARKVNTISSFQMVSSDEKASIERKKLQLDAIVVIFGTLTNGFSNEVYLLAKLII